MAEDSSQLSIWLNEESHADGRRYFLSPDGATADGKAVAAAIQSAPSPRKSGLAAQALKRLRKIPYWLQRAEMPVITGDSVEFSTWSNLPKTENDAFVVLGGLQENQPPL